MVSGVEAIVGAHSDPLYGPMLLVGAGGILVELARDVALRMLPVGARDISAMIDGAQAQQAARRLSRPAGRPTARRWKPPSRRSRASISITASACATSRSIRSWCVRPAPSPSTCACCGGRTGSTRPTSVILRERSSSRCRTGCAVRGPASRTGTNSKGEAMDFELPEELRSSGTRCAVSSTPSSSRSSGRPRPTAARSSSRNTTRSSRSARRTSASG